MAARILLLFIRIYQIALSPWLGGNCRFIPTCSVYAAECIGRFGAAKGTWLAIKRLSRCHPLGGFGHDPPPTLAGKVKGA